MAEVSQQMFLGNVPVFGYQNESLVAINLFDKIDIVQNGLQLWLDAGDTASYPGSGTTWTDLSGNSYNATLVNTPGLIGGATYFGVDAINSACSHCLSDSLLNRLEQDGQRMQLPGAALVPQF